MIGKKWLWWTMWLALKPNLKSGNFELFKIELANKTQFAQDHLEEVIKEKEEAEKKHSRIASEVDEIKVSLAGGTNAKEDLLNKITKLEDIKSGLQKEIAQLHIKINAETENIESLQGGLKKTESNQSTLGKEMRECENRLVQVQNEKADKDAQIGQMKEECIHQEELINKLNKEKKTINESKLKEEEQIQSFEDKCNHLNKLKIRLEKNLDEVEDNWEKENSSLNGKIEDEGTLGGKLNTQIKELQARIEELDEELDGERGARARADKGRGQLRRELDELNEKLEET